MDEFEFTKDSYSNFYDFLKKSNTDEFGLFGISQSCANYLYNTARTGENVEEFNRVKEWFMKKYNVSEELVIKIMRSLNFDGACSYSVLTGVIFNKFKDNPDEFESKFGFPMYTNIDSVRVLNETQLLMDLYIYTNHSKSGGTLFSYNENGETVITNPIHDTFDPSKQKYLIGFNGSAYYDKENANAVIDSYLGSYNIGGLEQETIATNLDGLKKVDISSSDFELISTKIEEALKKDESVLLTLSFDEIRYFSLTDYGDGNVEREREVKRDDSHVVNVVGTEDNALVITTDGKMCLIPIEDVINSGFVITKAKIKTKEEIVK